MPNKGVCAPLNSYGPSIGSESALRLNTIPIFSPAAVTDADKVGKSYDAEICIEGSDRKGILSDISRVCEDMDIHLSGVNAKTGKDGSLSMTITLSISSTQEMQKVFRNLRNIDGITHVFRAKS